MKDNFEPTLFNGVENFYSCNNCQNFSMSAVKKQKIINFPPILILTLGRYWFDRENQSIKKNMLKIPLLHIF